MGCQSSKRAATGQAEALNRRQAVQAKADAAAAERARRAKLNPNDFIVSKLKGAIVVKEAGAINGEQFNIEECVNCDIFLLDHMDSSFVDECENCRIFVGPTTSSVFIRNCRNCSMIIACRQFRSRDCSDCRFALLSTTEPVIETSTNMKFACFEFFYFSLAEQLDRANLKVWNNKWWQIHDFNKNADNPNWGVFPQQEVSSLLKTTACTNITDAELEMECVVPVTLGCRPRPHQDACFVLFLPQSNALVTALLSKAQAEGWAVCRTRSMSLLPDRAKELFAWTKENLVARCTGHEITGIELCAPNISDAVAVALKTTGLAAGADRNIRVVPAAAAADLAKKFFETWKDEI